MIAAIRAAPPVDRRTPAPAIGPLGRFLRAFGIANSTFARALRNGVRPDGTPIDSFMPWREFRAMNDTAVGALYTYLRTVPPRPFGHR